MGKVFIEETTLTAIGDAIRSKTGGEDLISPGNFAYEITNLPSGGGAEPEPIVLTGNCSYGCSGKLAGAYIDMYGDTITTNDLTVVTNMFSYCPSSHIPFDINIKENYSSMSLDYMFYSCENLIEVPKINNVKVKSLDSLCKHSPKIRYFPEDYGEDWDWSEMVNLTNQYSGKQTNLFNACYSLRKVPMGLIKYNNPKVLSSYSIYTNLFPSCYALDEVVDLPVLNQATFDSNAFGGTFSHCYRLKRMTFATDNGKPYTANWKNQYIDLSVYVGYVYSTITSGGPRYILDYNSGITADKEVKNDTDYKNLKNDADWFTCSSSYSRYNHDSAVETINSLPDTSAYGTNTIAFSAGITGSETDGGALETLTSAEIAVAANKGWTVSFK